MCFNKGKVIIISAPSGSGKTTIAKFLTTQNLNLFFSISACSRKKRENELDGKDYHFLKIEDFKKRIKRGDFLEWEEVYKNRFYGTLKKNVYDKLGAGKNVIFDVDVKGAISLKNFFNRDALSIYIDVPIDIIEQRLRNRKTEREQDILIRLAKIKEEINYKNEFDLIIINTDLEKTKKEIISRIKEYLQT